MKTETVKCRVCEQGVIEPDVPLCPLCGSLTVDPDELDLSPTADIIIIFKNRVAGLGWLPLRMLGTS